MATPPPHRSKKFPSRQTQDGWDNEISGLGRLSRDKRLSATVTAPYSIDDQQLSYLYDGNWLVQKIIEKPIKAALRKGFEVTGIDETQSDQLREQWNALDGTQLIKEALYWDALYGGALLIIGADDGQKDLTKPLRREGVKEVRYLQAIPRTWVQIVEREDGQPTVFRIQPEDSTEGYDIHISRTHWLPGGTVTPRQRAQCDGWGLSVLIPVMEIVRDFTAAYDGSFVLSQEFSQAIFRMTGLREALSQKATAAVKNRLEIMDLSKSIVRAMVLDADSNEDFERKTTNIAGLSELLTKFDGLLSAAADIPATVLFGTSPDGMNATGEGDIQNWEARIEEDRSERIEPLIRSVVSLLLGDVSGWTIKFAPLRQLTEKEQAEVHLIQAQADQVNITMGIVTPEEIRRSRFSGDEYTTRTDLIDTVDTSSIESLISALEAPDAEPAAELETPEQTQAEPEPDAAPVEGSPADPRESLNGAQVTALLNVLEQVSTGFLSKATAERVIATSFALPPEQVAELFADVVEGEAPPPPDPGQFEPKPEPEPEDE